VRGALHVNRMSAAAAYAAALRAATQGCGRLVSRVSEALIYAKVS
jgi:hypothetical protein